MIIEHRVLFLYFLLLAHVALWRLLIGLVARRTVLILLGLVGVMTLGLVSSANLVKLLFVALLVCPLFSLFLFNNAIPCTDSRATLRILAILVVHINAIAASYCLTRAFDRMRGGADRAFLVLPQVVAREIGRGMSLSAVTLRTQMLDIEDISEVLICIQRPISQQLAM